MPTCNVTLTEERIGHSETPLWHGFTFHHFGLVLSAAFGLVAVGISLWLIGCHATHYSKPWEQRHIIRILFMIPIYATVSFLSYLYYWHAIYFEVLRDCYEAFAIASFFTLLCHYIAPDLHEQKVYFRQLKPRNWILPINWFQKCTGGTESGVLRRPRSGLTWFNVIWIGVFQYCFIRVLFTIVSVLSQVAGRYCESSLNPAFAHIWVMVFEGSSVTVAMYCLIQFYIQLKTDLATHSPFLKVLCIKLVIFFSFWQTLLISFLSSSNGPLKPTAHIAYPDIKVGIPSTLLCIEMAIFATMHVFAFSWKPYSKHHQYGASSAFTAGGTVESFDYQGGKLGWKALMDAFNPWDIFKAIARGARWLFVGRRKRFEDVSYGGTKLHGSNLDDTHSFEEIRPSHNRLNPFADTAAAAPPTINIQPPSLRGSQRYDGSFAGAEDDDGEALLAHGHRPSGLETPRSVGVSEHSDYYGPSSASSSSVNTDRAGPHDLQDYQLQLMLLEQQNKKRLLLARQEQNGITPVEGQPGDLGTSGLHGQSSGGAAEAHGAGGRRPGGLSGGSRKGPRESIFREEEDTSYHGAASSPRPEVERSQSRPGVSRENSVEWRAGDEALFTRPSGKR